MIVYMAVTNDKYEYPVFICDSLKELAECVGKTPSAIAHRIKTHADGVKPRNFKRNIIRGERKNYKFMKLEIDYDPKEDIVGGVDGNGDENE